MKETDVGQRSQTVTVTLKHVRRANGTLTAVTSLGWAPCLSSRVTMSVCPCWAAWCSAVKPIWTGTHTGTSVTRGRTC